MRTEHSYLTTAEIARFRASIIAEHYNAMRADLAHLASLIRWLPPRYAGVVVVPPVPKGAEDEPIEEIPASVIEGREALEIAAACYQDMHIQPAHSQQIARRTVGLLWFSPAQIRVADEIRATIERINAAKASIEAFVLKTYHTRQARFEALRLDCPGLMTVHLYRQIRCFADGNVKAIRFTWQRKEWLRRPRKHELLRRLSTEVERAGPHAQPALEHLLRGVAATPEHLLRERRALRVQPSANIMTTEGLRTVTAPMPLILLQDAEPKIRMPRDYDASQSRIRRSDRAAATVLGTFAGATVEALSSDQRESRSI